MNARLVQVHNLTDSDSVQLNLVKIKSDSQFSSVHYWIAKTWILSSVQLTTGLKSLDSQFNSVQNRCKHTILSSVQFKVDRDTTIPSSQLGCFSH